MNFFLLDDRTLLKRYVLDSGTELIDYLFRQVSLDRLACSVLSVAEVFASLVRQRRQGRLTPTLFRGALLHFRTELLPARGLVKWPADHAVVVASLSFLEKHRLNVLDSIQIRAAVEIADIRRAEGHDLIILTAKAGLRRAARKEGIRTFDPEVQSRADLDVLLNL
jgi:hypothetical protein